MIEILFTRFLKFSLIFVFAGYAFPASKKLEMQLKIIFFVEHESRPENKFPTARKRRQNIITRKYVLQKIQHCLRYFTT